MEEGEGEGGDDENQKQHRKRPSNSTMNPLLSSAGKKKQQGKNTYSSLNTMEDEQDLEAPSAQIELTSRPAKKLFPPVDETEGSSEAKREEIREFYKKYNPSKLDTVEEILSRYQGKEDTLLEKLYKQYNITR
jgi:hypothetical protein